MSDARLSRIVALSEELLRVPSPTGEEARIADFLHERIAAHDPSFLRRAGNSLCFAMRAADPARRTLMLVGHVDTVPELDPNPVRREGDRLYGLGASDMKAAVALIVDTVLQSREHAPRHNLVGVLYAAEESSYDRSEMPLVRAAAPEWFAAADLAICMEPTDNRIELGCLGTAHATVTFRGKRAHSARPWQGDNAIHKAAPLLARLAAFEPVVHRFHGLEFREVASATTIGFRGARNVVPDACTVNVNHRFAPGKTEAEVRRELDALVQGEGEIEIVDFCPAGRVCADNALLLELRAAAGEPEMCAKQAWTDVGRLSHWGVDAINWGPGATAQAHQAGEWVSLADVARAAAVLERWLF